MSPRYHVAFSTLLAACMLTGCLLHRSKSHPPTIALQVNVAPKANDNSAVPFDVVTISDKSLLKQISQMDAATWFGPKGRCTFRGGPKAKVQFYSWQFVPGQTMLIDVPKMHGAKGVLGFAEYSTPGDHRVTFATSGSQYVEMGEEGVRALTKVKITTSKAPAPVMQKVCPDD